MAGDKDDKPMLAYLIAYSLVRDLIKTVVIYGLSKTPNRRVPNEARIGLEV